MDLPDSTREISVGWLNNVLHLNGVLGDANVTQLTIEPIGVGKGFLSDMARLHLTYDRSSPAPPPTMIAKLPTSYPTHRKIALLYNVYEKEIGFYTKIAPISPIRAPKLMFAAMEPDREKYVLLMEDCSGYEEADPNLNGLSRKQVEIIAEKIADFHARWWDDRSLFSLGWLKVLQARKDTEDVKVFRTYWDACTRIGSFREAFSDESWDAGLEIYEKRPWVMLNAAEDKLTFLHLDFKADNMFFDWKTPDDPLIVFDWSLTFIGRGIFDMSMLLGWSVDTSLRRQIDKDIVKRYYARLLERGVASYTYDECWTDYLKGLLQIARMPISLFSRVDENSSQREVKLAKQVVGRFFSAVADNHATDLLRP